MELVIESILNLDECEARGIFTDKKYPWEVLTDIGDYIYVMIKTLNSDYREISKDVWVGKGTTIANNVQIDGPTIIGENCEIRQGAYIRGKVIIGNKVVIGNSSELKNSIVFNNAQVPHFNYVGDSILGFKSHIGAGVILSNLKSDQSQIIISHEERRIETGLRKMGAIIGDHVEVGCNSVLNPGTVIGRKSNVYPLTFVRGVVPENHILKNNGELVEKR